MIDVPLVSQSGAKTTITVPDLVINQPPTQLTPYLPFEMVNTPSAKIVLGHITPWFPTSIDNKPQPDYYDTQWLTISGEGGAYAAYGGRLRDRPWPRAPLGTGWQVLDCRDEVRQAKSVGIDGFTIDMVSYAHKATVDAYFAACAAENFKCLPQADMSPNTPYASITETNFVNEMYPYLTHSASFRLPDGRPLLNCFLGETRPPAWWNNVKTILAGRGVNVALMLTQLNAGTVASYAGLCWAIGIWGTGTPTASTVAASMPYSTAAHQAGAKWIAPIRFNDVRPALAAYWESANHLSYRQSWDAANQLGEVAQLITWSDYNEGTQMARSAKHGWRHLDRMAYDIARFKYGTAPTVIRDTIYLNHRIQALNAVPQYVSPQPMRAMTSDIPRNNVEVEVFAVATSMLTTTVGPNTYTTQVPAGLSAYQYPIALGTVSAVLTRGGQEMHRAASQFPIVASPPVQDFQYVTGGGRR